MGDIVPMETRSGRKLSETVYTDRGLRLPEAIERPDGRWFLIAIIAIPAAVFLAILFW